MSSLTSNAHGLVGAVIPGGNIHQMHLERYIARDPISGESADARVLCYDTAEVAR